MGPTHLALLSLGMGVGIGIIIVYALQYAARLGRKRESVIAPVIPDGVDAVLNTLDSAALVLDPSNVVLQASPGAMSLGLVDGLTLVNAELIQIVDEVRSHGDTIDKEIIINRSGYFETQQIIQIRCARLGSRYVLILATDRSEQYRLDQVRRDFIANISHDLKTPIASVSLLAEAISRATDEPIAVVRFADRLRTEADRLGQITSEIIELSRLQAKEATQPTQLVNVDAAVLAAADRNQVVADSAGVEVVVKAKSLARIYGDTELLIAAVHNLISNAITFSNPGGRVGVGAAIEDRKVAITVTDQGIGINEEDLERVFERFYRADLARSRDTGGSGLGLSIVKHTVSYFGGEIKVWSKPGYGSTFIILLPLAAGVNIENKSDTD